MLGFHSLINRAGQMDSLIESITAGAAAALFATAILGLVTWIYHLVGRRRDQKYIRNIISEGKERVLKAKDTYHVGMKATIGGDVLRAAQYNNMITKLNVALKKWATHLTHDQRKDILDSLDWYHTDGLQFTSIGGVAKEVAVPPGKWPTMEMSLDLAKAKFEKLQSIKWLNL